MHLGVDDPITVTAADLDKDGDVDLLVDGSKRPRRCSCSETTAAASSRPASRSRPRRGVHLPGGRRLERATVSPDIAVGSGTGRLLGAARQRLRRLSAAAAVRGGDRRLLHARGAADLNGDGNIDLVARSETETAAGTVVLRGDGSGDFDAGIDVSAGPTALSLRLADVNGDGRPDLVAHHPTLRTVAVQTGTGWRLPSPRRCISRLRTRSTRQHSWTTTARTKTSTACRRSAISTGMGSRHRRRGSFRRDSAALQHVRRAGR